MADKQLDKYLPKLRFPEFKDEGEWQVVRLGDVVRCFSGGTPSATNKDYYGGDIPFIRSGELHSSKTELYLTRAGLENSSAKMVEKGTILYALYGATSGDVGIARVSGAINQAILAIIPNANIDKMYLYQYLSYSKDFIINRFLQGGQGNLSASIITSLSIPLPTIQEQKKIASCLSSLDDFIVASKEKLVQLKAHKEGLMQKLFPATERTLPEIRFAEGKWGTSILDDMIEIITPPKRLLSTDYGQSGLYPIVDQSKEYICGFSNDSDAVFNKTSEDVIVFGDHTCILKFVNFPFIQGADGIKVFKSKFPEIVSTRFLFHYLSFIPIPQCQYKRHFSELKEKSIRYPNTLLEQTYISATLSSLDECILTSKEKLVKLKAHKKGLMQQIFSIL